MNEPRNPKDGDEVFFDGDCPMCRDIAAHLGRVKAGTETFTPLQTAGTSDSLGVSRSALMELMHLRTADGRILTGADSVVYMLSRRWWGRIPALLFRLPGAMPAARFVYGHVARRRIALSAILLRLPWILPAGWAAVCAALWALSGASTSGEEASSAGGAFGPVEALFLLAPTALVPSIAGLLRAGAGRSPFSIAEAVPLAAAGWMAALSFAFPKGWAAMVLALPWGLAAARKLAGAVASLAGPVGRAERAVHEAAGRLFLAVGAAWLLASRAGWMPFGFEEPFVLLTAVHFHFAGFAATGLILAAFNGPGPLDRAARWTLAGLEAGIPLVAAGFSGVPWAKPAGAVILAVSGAGVALLFLARAMPASGAARWLLALSAGAISAGMALALAYEAGEASGRSLLSIPWMAATHGPLNGLIFPLGALWGLAILERRRAAEAGELPGAGRN